MRSGAPFSLAALSTLAAWVVLAHGVAGDPRRVVSFLMLAVAVFLFLPAAMSAAMCAVVTVPIAVLGPIAAGARVVTGRPTGFRDLIAEFLGLGLAVVPGYVRALGKVRSPGLWGSAAGSVAALPVLAATVPTVA